MTNKSSVSVAEAKQVGRFGAVGVLNTLLDFVIYNLLFGFVGLDVRVANLISTTCAMIFSFFANKRMVFRKREGSLVKQAVIFYLVTAFGLYVLQTGTIHLLTDVWLAPMHLAVQVIHTLGLGTVFSDTFVINNGAKAVGTVLSLSWNYVLYKKVVFR